MDNTQQAQQELQRVVVRYAVGTEQHVKVHPRVVKGVVKDGLLVLAQEDGHEISYAPGAWISADHSQVSR